MHVGPFGAGNDENMTGGPEIAGLLNLGFS